MYNCIVQEEAIVVTKEEIGAILKELRIKSGKTQKQIADILGRKQQIIGHWETGYSQPDANTLFVLCKLYNASVDASFGFVPDTAPTQTPDQDELLQNYNSLNDMGQQALLEQSRMMCKSNTYKKDDGHKFIPKNA